MRLHPDQGGTNELMILLQESYEFMKENPKSFKELIEFSGILKKSSTTNQSLDKYQKSYEDIPLNDQRLEIIKEIYTYSKNNDNFNTSFVESVCEFGNKKGFITSGQYNSLVNVYYSFRMFEKDEE